MRVGIHFDGGYREYAFEDVDGWKNCMISLMRAGTLFDTVYLYPEE